MHLQKTKRCTKNIVWGPRAIYIYISLYNQSSGESEHSYPEYPPRGPVLFFAGLGFAYKPKTQQRRPESANVTQKAPKRTPIEQPSSLEELLNRLCVKRLQYQIRSCLLMFAAHLVACKINICVIRGCNIGSNLVLNAHADNGVTFNRKVSKMRPHVVQKASRKQSKCNIRR